MKPCIGKAAFFFYQFSWCFSIKLWVEAYFKFSYFKDERFAVMKSSEMDWTLGIKFVNRDDEGIYVCQVRYHFNGQTNRNHRIAKLFKISKCRVEYLPEFLVCLCVCVLCICVRVCVCVCICFNIAFQLHLHTCSYSHTHPSPQPTHTYTKHKYLNGLFISLTKML